MQHRISDRSEVHLIVNLGNLFSIDLVVFLQPFEVFFRYLFLLSLIILVQDLCQSQAEGMLSEVDLLIGPADCLKDHFHQVILLFVDGKLRKHLLFDLPQSPLLGQVPPLSEALDDQFLAGLLRKHESLQSIRTFKLLFEPISGKSLPCLDFVFRRPVLDRLESIQLLQFFIFLLLLHFDYS